MANNKAPTKNLLQSVLTAQININIEDDNFEHSSAIFFLLWGKNHHMVGTGESYKGLQRLYTPPVVTRF